MPDLESGVDQIEAVENRVGIVNEPTTPLLPVSESERQMQSDLMKAALVYLATGVGYGFYVNYTSGYRYPKDARYYAMLKGADFTAVSLIAYFIIDKVASCLSKGWGKSWCKLLVAIVIALAVCIFFLWRLSCPQDFYKAISSMPSLEVYFRNEKRILRNMPYENFFLDNICSKWLPDCCKVIQDALNRTHTNSSCQLLERANSPCSELPDSTDYYCGTSFERQFLNDTFSVVFSKVQAFLHCNTSAPAGLDAFGP